MPACITLPGEEDIIGPHMLNSGRPIPDNSSVQLLVEVCTGTGVAVATTFQGVRPEQ